jgi:epoxyqueuosine reductase
MESFNGNPAGFIRGYIEQMIATSPENRLFMIDESPIFEAPLVGFASGADPLFEEYKRIIGPYHLTPLEALRADSTLPTAEDRLDPDPKGLTVICWALPISRRTRKTNADRDTYPSLRWGHTKVHGEAFNDLIRQKVVGLLRMQGYLATAPFLLPVCQRMYNSTYVYPAGPVSPWSERHALYAAGLGTFGLSDGFITPRGIAMRCGTVVVNLKIPPTPRPYASHVDNCSFYTDKSCTVCIDRCPAGAITIKGHDKALCHGYFRDDTGFIREERY